ncbi:MAG: cbb3-type cytochrome c oxidase subunit I [Gemmatimonadaceae bacterium]
MTADSPMDVGGESAESRRDDIAIRVRADESSRRVALVSFSSAIVWLLVGSVFGEISSLKMHIPDLLVNEAWLTFGRVRPSHLNAMIYGWASLAMMGVSLWMMPRLLHTELRFARVAELGIWLWNIGVTIGIAGILSGHSDGLEWLELPRFVSVPWLIVGGGMVGVSLLATLAARRAEHLYVSVWYIMAAYLWFPIIFVIGNWPAWTGVESAATNWFYAHNTLGLWLTSVSLGAAYYFIPKVLGRPVHSYQLSLLGFWTLAFFYALNGMHHLIGGPVPEWMITTSIVASGLMVIPVLAVGINHHMTMLGRFTALRYSPTLRFVVFGAMSYTAVSLQGTFTAFRAVNRVTHFTQWTIAHAHVGVYGFVTFVMFGSIYYIMPRIMGREWPSARLISWHFWLVASGLVLYVVPLSVAGVMQGLVLLDPQAPFESSIHAVMFGLVTRSVAGLVLMTGHGVFAWHFWWMTRARAAEGIISPFHEVRPILFLGQQPASIAANKSREPPGNLSMRPGGHDK